MLCIQANHLSAIIPDIQFTVGKRHTSPHAINYRLVRFTVQRVGPELRAMNTIKREEHAVPRGYVDDICRNQRRAGNTITRIKRPEHLAAVQIERPELRS